MLRHCVIFFFAMFLTLVMCVHVQTFGGASGRVFAYFAQNRTSRKKIKVKSERDKRYCTVLYW